jgi:hypothetical protein
MTLADTVPISGDKGQLEDRESESEYESEEEAEADKTQEPNTLVLDEVSEPAEEPLVKQEDKPAAGGFSIGGDDSDEEVETLDN